MRFDRLQADAPGQGACVSSEQGDIMGSHTRKGRYGYARNQLALEQLEARELMAGDTIASTVVQDTSTVLAGRLNPSVKPPTSGQTTASTATPTLVASALANPRSIDGTGNNQSNPLLGSVGQQLGAPRHPNTPTAFPRPTAPTDPAPARSATLWRRRTRTPPPMTGNSPSTFMSGVSSSTTTSTSRPRGPLKYFRSQSPRAMPSSTLWELARKQFRSPDRFTIPQPA